MSGERKAQYFMQLRLNFPSVKHYERFESICSGVAYVDYTGTGVLRISLAQALLCGWLNRFSYMQKPKMRLV
jgi:hypothetical protein